MDTEIGRDFLAQEKIRHEAARKAQIGADAEAKRQEDELAKDAEDYIAEGNLEAAEALLDSEVVVNPSVPVPEVQKTVRADAGSTTVLKDIAVEVTDKRLVLEAIVAGNLPDTLVTVDVGAAKRYAKVSGLTKMPGFRVTETAVVSGRTN